jgi:hypothetical protein
VEEALPEGLLVLEGDFVLVPDADGLVVGVYDKVAVEEAVELTVTLIVRVGLPVIVLLELDVELRVGAELIVVEADALAVSDIYEDEVAEADGEPVTLTLGVRVDVLVPVEVRVPVALRVSVEGLLAGLIREALDEVDTFADLVEDCDSCGDFVGELLSV